MDYYLFGGELWHLLLVPHYYGTMLDAKIIICQRKPPHDPLFTLVVVPYHSLARCQSSREHMLTILLTRARLISSRTVVTSTKALTYYEPVAYLLPMKRFTLGWNCTFHRT